MQGQQVSTFQRRWEAHAVGVVGWMTEVSPMLYAEFPIFAPISKDFYEQQGDDMPTQSLRIRFASAEDMENYFTSQD